MKAAVLLALVSLLAPGCGPSAIDSACESCSKDPAKCKQDLEQLQKDAADRGCQTEFDRVVACIDGATCKDGEVVGQQCSQEQIDLATCGE